METRLMLWVIFFFYCISNKVANSQDAKLTASPKIWSRFQNHSWVCGESIDFAIQCDIDYDYIKIARCYCIYYDFNTNSSQFGTCLATCFNPQFGAYFKVKRYTVENASLFNKEMCVESYSTFHYRTNRTGRFCGSCQEGHGLSVYSYQLSACISCSNYSHMNWAKYMAISLIPLVVFYFLIVTLKINFTSSYLSGVVTSIQIMVSPVNLHILNAWMSSGSINGVSLLQGLVACYGPLNLDFFRDLYSPFCLGPKFNSLRVISLDYIPGLMPFLLIFFTYFLIKLYDRNFVLLVWAWKPFKYILNRYYKQLSPHTSLVETFATFILLSSVKIASISLYLLVPVTIYNENGKRLSKYYLYADSNIEWFGKEHLPYGLLALATGIIFVILPLVLMLLYPCRCFQVVLNKLGWNSQALRVFMDAFQGCYRLKPYDMRYFSAYYLFLRVFIVFLTAAIRSIFTFCATTLCLVLNATFIYSIQPCRSPTHNRIDGLAMSMLAFCYVSILTMMSTFYLDSYWIIPSNISFGASQFVIVSFFFTIFGWVLFRHKLQQLFSKVKFCLRRNKVQAIEVEREDYLKSLSERSTLITYSSNSVY